jgi:hypothetical protein
LTWLPNLARPIAQICRRFLAVVVLRFLQGVFAKMAFLLWCFCGEFVVECVVNVVEKHRVFVR